MIYNKLQLDRVLSITAADIALPLQWQESRLTVHRHACEHWCSLKGTAGPYPYREVHGITSIPPRHDDPSHQPRGVIISLEEATEGQKYNPWREKHLDERAVGLDFDDVFSLWQWLDAATPTVEWILRKE